MEKLRDTPAAWGEFLEKLGGLLERFCQRWLNQDQAASYIGVHRSYLERRRKLKLDPAFSQIGKIVRYCRQKLDEFLLVREVATHRDDKSEPRRTDKGFRTEEARQD